ncbi:uncharacterized protein LOC113986101 [Pipra filicauda]|uniref:Uncharacterized protein LOC113986101 n=1 Tax=Pipra filicauda TaxID=649802 RepID=A0A7R5KKL2_9PASS|nr:uncharacterized protein LOC113986101 [Pipra filicauda]
MAREGGGGLTRGGGVENPVPGKILLPAAFPPFSRFFPPLPPGPGSPLALSVVAGRAAGPGSSRSACPGAEPFPHKPRAEAAEGLLCLERPLREREGGVVLGTRFLPSLARVYFSSRVTRRVYFSRRSPFFAAEALCCPSQRWQRLKSVSNTCFRLVNPTGCFYCNLQEGVSSAAPMPPHADRQTDSCCIFFSKEPLTTTWTEFSDSGMLE